jgi:hypothetical protein
MHTITSTKTSSYTVTESSRDINIEDKEMNHAQVVEQQASHEHPILIVTLRAAMLRFTMVVASQ